MTKLELAHRVREACEKYSKRARWTSSELEGMCAIASTLLARLFHKHGYDATIIYGSYKRNDHCWVESDGEWWDITYTQFDINADRITIFPAGTQDFEVYESYTSTRCKRFVRQFKGWPKEQRPFYFRLRVVLRHLKETKVACG